MPAAETCHLTQKRYYLGQSGTLDGVKTWVVFAKMQADSPALQDMMTL
jgi:hypothetical protein